MVWRNAFGDPSMALTPFRERVAEITARRIEQSPRSAPGELDTDRWVDRLTRDGHFAAIQVEEFAWSITMSLR
ncbi:hypothetical protein F3087_42245 [Nocardia colli]|uniref:Uncharacterized protein n=1 Tax=Nocardia colli TaxID=2545717 RepID=A0A5N0DVQ1_9NOCA|nr:hypothetical protein F3087_42245 [Nocardia colli]